ncbi:MAG: reprolysin-like metallopeptidase, partial [Cyclobacteriaceae bacterium]
ELWTQSSPTFQRANATVNPGKNVVLNLENYRQTLSLASLNKSQTYITVPTPHGKALRFALEETNVMEPGLARRYPHLKTYTGYDPEDPRNRIRLDFNGQQTHIAVSTPDGSYLVDPAGATCSQYAVFDEGQDPGGISATGECLAPAEYEAISKNTFTQATAESPTNTPATYIKQFRIAVAATGEYTQFRGGKDQAMAAIVTLINRANLVTERDLGVRFILSANTDQLIYTDPATDPYSGNTADAATWLDAAQQTFDNLLGSTAYDLGHVLTFGSGGAAFTGTLCNDGGKGKGRSGQQYAPGHTADMFTFLHETGHQMGGTHTFNGNESECQNNYYAPTAWEPGSGTTLMSYAYFCGGQRLETESNRIVNYFHGGSIEQITQVTNEACPTLIQVDNQVPEAHIPDMQGRILPKGTPFVLRGSHFDADGDRVTYNWEQMNTGPQGAPGNPEGTAPVFRSFSPSAEASRSFPQLSDLLQDQMTAGEVLPDYGRDLTFRFTVRDQMGAQDWADLTLSVSDTIGPLAFTYPSANAVLAPGAEATLLWDVNNTDKAPVSLNELNLLMSLDNGQTWDILTFFTPNDGEHTLIIPDVNTTTARLKLESTDGTVYTISPQFSIDNSSPSPCEAIAVNTGRVYTERWDNIYGNAVPTTLPFQGNTYTKLPDTFGSLEATETKRNAGDYYLRRMQATFCPPQSGDYHFYIYSDDQSKVYLYPLGQPSERRVIASVDGYTNYREWAKYSSQKSAATNLQAGTVYVLEVHHKDNKGWDHMGVGWELPNSTMEMPIAGHRLSPYIPYATSGTPELQQTCTNGTVDWHLNNLQDSLLIEWTADTSRQILMATPGSFKLPATEAYQVTVAWLNEAGIRQSVQKTRACEDQSTTPEPSIVSEVWYNVPGREVTSIPTTSTPDSLIELEELSSGDFGNTYGERIRVMFHPSASGYHKFMISGDDQAELYFSADGQPGSKQSIARATTWTLQGEYTRFPEQISEPIYLEQGQAYYMEVLHKEYYGNGHVQVGFENTTTGDTYAAIPASFLSSYGDVQNRMAENATDAQIAETLQTTGAAPTFSAYPNPSTGMITVESTSGSLPAGKLSVLDTSGAEIKVMSSQGGPVRVDLSGQMPGLYLLRWHSEEGIFTERVIVE